MQSLQFKFQLDAEYTCFHNLDLLLTLLFTIIVQVLFSVDLPCNYNTLCLKDVLHDQFQFQD